MKMERIAFIGFVASLLLLGASLSAGKAVSALNKDLTLENWQKIVLDEFRQSVRDILPHDYMKEEIYLVKWLRARNWDTEAATRMLINNLEWRKVNKIDTILEEDWSEFEKNFPYRLDTISKDGKPILTIDFGTWDIRTMAISGKLPQLVRYVTGILEKAAITVRQLQKEGKNVTQIESLSDMDNYSAIRQGCLQCIPYYTMATIIYESYYPGLIDNIVAINTPPAYQIPLRTVLPLLSTMTRSSIHIIGKNKAVWDKVVDDIASGSQLLSDSRENNFSKKE